VLIALIVALGTGLLSVRAGAQSDQQWLVVRYVVCPNGIATISEECGNRVAYDVTVSVRVLSTGDVIATGVAPDENGDAWIDISGYTPGTLRVNGEGLGSAGNIGTSCAADGTDVSADGVPGYHANALFDVETPADGDVFCTHYVYGHNGDVENYGIVESGSASTTNNDPGTGDIEVVSLPNTGSGLMLTGESGLLLDFLLVAALIALFMGLALTSTRLARLPD
jgi:hypothetical protein